MGTPPRSAAILAVDWTCIGTGLCPPDEIAGTTNHANPRESIYAEGCPQTNANWSLIR